MYTYCFFLKSDFIDFHFVILFLDCTKGYSTKSNEQKACVTGCKEEKLIIDNKSKKVLEVSSPIL